MKVIDILAAVLLVIGGLNWGLVALAQFDLVAALFGLGFGETSVLSRMVYALVGASAVYQALSLQSIQKRWGVEAALTS